MTLLHRQMPPSRPPPNVPSTFIPRDTCNYKMLRHHKIHCHDINLEKSFVFVCLFIGFGNFQRMLKQCRTIVNFVSIPLYCTAILITTLFFFIFYGLLAIQDMGSYTLHTVLLVYTDILPVFPLPARFFFSLFCFVVLSPCFPLRNMSGA